MKQLLKVTAVICILLSVFQTYVTLIETPRLIGQLFLPMLFIGLLFYYGSQFVLGQFQQLQRYPRLQLVILYLAGISVGILMTLISRGWTWANVGLALRINLVALPLFLVILVYWRRQDVKLNQALVSRQIQVKQLLKDEPNR